MTTDMDQFAKGMQEQLNAFVSSNSPAAAEPVKQRKSFRHAPAVAPFVYDIEMAVRMKPLEMDTVVSYRIPEYNQKAAMKKARQKALDDGWAIQGFIFNVVEKERM